MTIGAATPLPLRGSTPAGRWPPPSTQTPPANFYEQLAALHAHDAVICPAIVAALAPATAPPRWRAWSAALSRAARCGLMRA